VLAFVQRFMRLITEVALAYCGDVKDFEGDGALLYFDSTAEAASAALAIRDALAGGRECADAACPVSARLSLTVGEVVLGEIGAAGRRAVALVGPSVGIGARLLKQIEPGGIIASGEVVEELRDSAPELAARCRCCTRRWPSRRRRGPRRRLRDRLTQRGVRIRPGRALPMRPSSTTTAPLTTTYGMPVG
jgi:class 3 adenylate cyclase